MDILILINVISCISVKMLAISHMEEASFERLAETVLINVDQKILFELAGVDMSV